MRFKQRLKRSIIFQELFKIVGKAPNMRLIRKSNRIKYVWPTLLMLCLISAQTSCSQEQKETRYIKNNEFEGIILPTNSFKGMFSNYKMDWIPNEQNISSAEELIKLNLNGYKTDNSYEKEMIPKILEKISKYKRQYLSFVDKDNNKIIWINYFMDEGHKDFPNWDKFLVMVKGGGWHYFNIQVNLTQNRCDHLNINGPL